MYLKLYHLFYLTFPKNDDIIIKLSDENLFRKTFLDFGIQVFRSFFEKSSKKYLTKSSGSDIINKSSAKQMIHN